MAEYIEREAAIRALCDAVHDKDGNVPCRNQIVSCLHTGTRTQEYAEKILAIPAADVRPVVHGKWIDEPIYKQTLDGKTFDGYTYCSNCKADYPFGHKAYFCEVCGADMRKVEKAEMRG